MDSSPGSDGMDWKEDSSLHIIQPASSPWRKRSFDTYNETIEPYHPNEYFSGYQVTDTLRHHPEVVAPFIDSLGRPAQYVTDSHGNVVLQPVIQRQPPQPIGYYLPEIVKWIIYGAALLVFSSCEYAGYAYIHTATVAVRVGNSAKRRLVEVTKKTFAPTPTPRRHRHNVPPHRRRSPIIRRVSPAAPGGRTHIPVTPPRARPTATLKGLAVTNDECVVDYIPSNKKHVRYGAFVTSSEDDHLMSGVTSSEDDHLMSGVAHQPYYEPLMSGALHDIEMDEDAQSNVPSSYSPYHIPGAFPESPAPPELPSAESPTPDSQASDDLSIPYDQNTHGMATLDEQAVDALATPSSEASDEQAADALATPSSEASDEPDIPDVQPTIKFPLQEVDSRPRNYKGELLDDWQIKVCREFQALHPPPRDIRRQATNVPEQPQGPDSTELIESRRFIYSNGSPINPHQQRGTNATGSIDSCPSPRANVSPTGAASVMMDLHESTSGLLHQPHGTASIGSNDLHRSPLDLHRATTEVLLQPPGMASIGSNDSYRSPLVDVSPTRAGNALNDSHDATTDIFLQPARMATNGSINSSRSPLADVSPINSPLETIITGSIDSSRSPLVSVSPINLQHETIATGSIDSSRSPLISVSPTNSQHETIATGSIDSPRSLLADVSPTNSQHETIATGSIDSPRSLLADVSPTNSQHETIATGLIDSPRSLLADVSPTNSQHETIATGLIDSPRSLLADVSPINSRYGTNSIGSIDSPRSPIDVSPIHLPPGTSTTGSIVSPRSLLAESPMGEAVNAMTDTREADLEVSGRTLGATPVPSTSPLTSPLATMTTTPIEPPSTWSIRSLYARVQGKPKKRTPLRERMNNANIHKLPKTPKKVTWPENGPVTGTKRFIKHEAMSHPSPSSSRGDSSILSSVPSDFSPQPSPTMQEEEEEAAWSPSCQLHPPTSANDDWSMSPISSDERDIFNPLLTIEHTDVIHNPCEEQTIRASSSSDNEASVPSIETPKKTVAADLSTPPSLSPKFEHLTISTRRSSLRRREKEDQAQKLRDAIAAKEKARKDKKEAEEKARRDKEEAEERARIKAEEEEERKKTGGRRIPIKRVIESLPPDWDEKVRINMAKGLREQLAMTSVGNPLTRRDFGMVLPQPGTGDDPSGWLNDEIISGYLQAVVDHGHRVMGHPRGAKPRMHAFTPFFYTTMKERGYDAVKRWSARAKISGNDLKTVEYVFIPCNPSRNHWTLVVVSPVRKTIEVFDSMHGASLDKVTTTKLWLKGELGRSYVDSEWTVVEDPVYRGRGKGPAQNNVNDCGVFAVTTAKMIVLGVDPMAVSAEDMPLQRRRVVAELLNGGFSGDFEPRVVFE